MSLERARRLLLQRLGAGGVVLLAILLELSIPPAWCSGVDADGRAVCLVGLHNFGASDPAQAVIRAVLAALRAGDVPVGVVAVAYKPKASEFIVEVVSGQSREVAAIGGRGSGKTQTVPAAGAILAELHVREGFSCPLRMLWMQDTLTNWGMKTGRSVENEMWQGCWSVRDDRRQAVLTLAGQELVVADAVGTKDETSAERLRAECHVLAAEELAPSLNESSGIEQRKYELGLTSMRLPTRRHVAFSTTNHGYDDDWFSQRFLEGGGKPWCVACKVPIKERVTAEEIANLRASLCASPDLQKRLIDEESCVLVQGEQVAVGFRSELHVSPMPLRPVPNLPFVAGHDAGLTPVTILGQEVQGEIRVYAALVSERAGTRQHLENLVLPWLAVHAPWAMYSSSALIHYYDVSMDTPDESNLESSPIRVLREVLGGSSYPGAISWPGRRDPLLSLLARLNPMTGRARLQLDAEGCRQLIQACNGRCYYPTVNGHVSRELPVKNHPWSDLMDSLCYMVGGLFMAPILDTGPVKVETEFSLDPHPATMGARLW